MTDEQIIIAIAKLDGWEQGEMDTHWFSKLNVESGNYSRETGDSLPPYLNSRDAIIPVIKKQNFTEEQWETFLIFCVPEEKDWIACNVIWNDKSGKLQQSRLPRAYRILVTLTAKQLSIALLKATNNYKK